MSIVSVPQPHPCPFHSFQFVSLLRAIRVSNLLFAFCRFRNKNPHRAESTRLDSKVAFVLRPLPPRGPCLGPPPFACPVLGPLVFLFVCNKFADKRRIIAGSCRYPCTIFLSASVSLPSLSPPCLSRMRCFAVSMHSSALLFAHKLIVRLSKASLHPHRISHHAQLAHPAFHTMLA